MQFLKVLRRNRIGLSHQLHGRGRAGNGAHAAADAPFPIDHREIAFHLDDLDGTDLHALPASGASLPVRLPEEIGGHQDVPWNSLPPDRPNGPATAAATVAGMLDAFPRIVDQMNETRLFRLSDHLKGLCFVISLPIPFSIKILGQFIIFDAVLEGMIASFLPDQLGRGPAGAMDEGNHVHLPDQFFHHLKGEDRMAFRFQRHGSRDITEGLRRVFP